MIPSGRPHFNGANQLPCIRAGTITMLNMSQREAWQRKSIYYTLMPICRGYVEQRRKARREWVEGGGGWNTHTEFLLCPGKNKHSFYSKGLLGWNGRNANIRRGRAMKTGNSVTNGVAIGYSATHVWYVHTTQYIIYPASLHLYTYITHWVHTCIWTSNCRHSTTRQAVKPHSN